LNLESGNRDIGGVT